MTQSEICSVYLAAGRVKLPKLVYIGGYGHSGSTLLERLMTASSDVLACGEVASCLRKRTAAKSKCTCGRHRTDCPTWSAVYRSSDDLRDLTYYELLLTLLRHASGDYAVLVDSSKTAWGSFMAPMRLRRALGKEFLLVHLVRDPRAVCWSTIAKADRKHEFLSGGSIRLIRTALGWCAANLSCEIFGRLYPHDYQLVRYEDLANSPETVLSDLFRIILPGERWRMEELGVHDNRHQLHGNRMRRSRLSLSDVREQVAWKTAMSSSDRRLVDMLTWPLRSRYGY